MPQLYTQQYRNVSSQTITVMNLRLYRNSPLFMLQSINMKPTLEPNKNTSCAKPPTLTPMDHDKIVARTIPTKHPLPAGQQAMCLCTASLTFSQSHITHRPSSVTLYFLVQIAMPSTNSIKKQNKNEKKQKRAEKNQSIRSC